MRYLAMSAPRLSGGPGAHLYPFHERVEADTTASGCASRRSAGELDAGVAVAAVAERVLREVLLVVVLGVVVRRGLADLGGDVTEPAPAELVPVDLRQLAGGLLLLGRGEVDRRAVLRADVVALAEALRRVVDLEELLHEVGVRDHGRVEHDPDRLGVVRRTGADLLVRRVRGGAAGVADPGRPDARQLPVDLLGAPEAAEAEESDLVALGHLVGDQRRVEDAVLLG